jgi:hypothetical protein
MSGRGTSGSGSSIVVERSGDWELVNDALGGFEDGVVREYWLDGASWVTHDDHLAEDGYPRLVVVVQLQSSSVAAVRLTFEGVRTVRYERKRDVSPAVARDERDGWIVEFLSCCVAASSCIVEPLGSEWLGRGPFLGSDQAR